MAIKHFKVTLKYIATISLVSLLIACATIQPTEQRDASYTKKIREIKLTWTESKEYKTKITMAGDKYSPPVITDYHKQFSRNNIIKLLYLMRLRASTEIGTRFGQHKIEVLNDSSRNVPTLRLVSSEGITHCSTVSRSCTSSILIDVSLHSEVDQKPVWSGKFSINDGGYLQANSGNGNGNSTSTRYLPNDLELLEKLTDQIATSLIAQGLIAK